MSMLSVCAYMYVCRCAPECVEARRGHQVPQSWNFKGLWLVKEGWDVNSGPRFCAARLLTTEPPFQLEKLLFETLIYILCSLAVDRTNQYPMEKDGIKFSPTGGKFTYIIWVALPIGLFLSSITYLYIWQLYGEGSQIFDLLYSFQSNIAYIL